MEASLCIEHPGLAPTRELLRLDETEIPVPNHILDFITYLKLVT